MKCLRWKALERGAMLGFADLQLDNGMVLLGCTLLQSNGRRWCNPPSRPQLDSDKKLTFEGGKLLYSPIIEFTDKALRSAWSDAAVAAIAAVANSTTPTSAGANAGVGTGSDPWAASHRSQYAG